MLPTQGTILPTRMNLKADIPPKPPEENPNSGHLDFSLIIGQRLCAGLLRHRTTG